MILGPAARRSGDFRAKIYNPDYMGLCTYVFLSFCVSVGISEFTMLRCDAVILGYMICTVVILYGWESAPQRLIDQTYADIVT